MKSTSDPTGWVTPVVAFTHALKALGHDISNRKHEPEVPYLSQVLSGSPTCLHLGASDGLHSFAILQAAPKARIYAFEPASFNIQTLRIGLKMRGLAGRVTAIHAAVGETAGDMTLVTPQKKTGKRPRAYAFISSGATDREDFDGIGHFQETVPVVRLDDCGFDHIDFIRMDIEGGEHAAMKGAMGILERDRPHALIEVHPVILRQRFNSSAEEFAALFRALGYRFFALAGNVVEERQTLDPTGSYGDFFFIHPDRPLPPGQFRDLIERSGRSG